MSTTGSSIRPRCGRVAGMDVEGAEVYVLPISMVWPEDFCLESSQTPSYDSSVLVDNLAKHDVPLESYYRAQEVQV